MTRSLVLKWKNASSSVFVLASRVYVPCLSFSLYHSLPILLSKRNGDGIYADPEITSKNTSVWV